LKRFSKPTKLNPDKRLIIVIVNCRSVNKIPEPHQVVDQVQSDRLCLTETWWKPEIFPCQLGYQIYRDDRTSGKGRGVLLAVTNKFLSEEQAELKTDCNIIWSKNSITGIKDIYVSSFYKPHEHDEHSLKELWSSVGKIPQNSHIWIPGYFNLPDMNWSNESPSDTCWFKEMFNILQKIW